MPDFFADKAVSFFNHLQLRTNFPKGVELMNPYRDDKVKAIVGQFFMKYYDDKQKRTGLFGINPGRFGAGITGIAFTDPVNLKEKCGIDNKMQQKHELSSEFVYEMIDAYGGTEKFNEHFFLTAVCPLGFVKEGKNLNYYDRKDLQNAVQNFIIESINKQIAFGLHSKVCLCLGEGKNFKYLDTLNREHNFFEKIIPLAHPRYIMQYKRKQKRDYVKKYLDALERSLVI